MNIQTSNAVSIIAIELTTTLETISADVGCLPEKLAGEIMQYDIRPTGPMMFLYDGVTGDRQAPIQLQIALPVSVEAAERYNGDHKVTRLAPFQFVECVLHGDISKLDSGAYAPLFAEIGKHGLSLTGFTREVYQNFVDVGSADNETRVQVAVAA